MNETPTNNTVPASVRASGNGFSVRGLLTATAALLAAAILLRAGGLGTMPWDADARADMIGASGDYVAMTTNGGVEELLFLVDARSERLMVYRVRNGVQVQQAASQDLRELFTTARAAYIGATPGRRP